MFYHKALWLFICISSVEALSPSGRNVQRVTRVESYTVRDRYTTKCGFLNWGRCTRYRTVTRTRIATDYRCVTNWVSVDNVHCDKALCFGSPAGTCANGGTCARPNVCSCRTGFTTPSCADVNECSRGNGGCLHRCTNTHGSFRCSCNSGYGLLSDRKTCRPVCFGLSPGVCSNGGTCVSPNTCSCRSGYSKPQCADVDECRNNNGGCNQICQNYPGSYRCTCHSGYRLDADRRTCKPQCFEFPLGRCQNGGTCVSPNNCRCPSGFSTPRCDDTNECNTANGGCSQVCTNTLGSFKCSCSSGYGLVGKTDCKPICFGGVPGECPNGGKCLSPDRCSCSQGYTGSPCADVNECVSNNGGCAQNCINSEGSFTCSCNDGYQLATDGKSCLAVCNGLPAGECANGGTCIERGVCTCPNGFSPPDCQDVNECESSNGGCEQGCENTDGSFICQCSQGYQLDTDGKSCIDVDECLAGTSGCSHFCVNEPGSYHCDCPLGYQLDDKTCRDIDECSTNNGGCNQYCVNSEGSYQCSCEEGFVLDADQKTCQDASDCGAKKFVWCWPQCTASGSSCSCPAGHILHSNGVNCVDPCFNRPCEHEGVCSKPSPDSTSYTCDCDATGYEGQHCEIGIITYPESVRVRAGELSDDILITAFPEEELILTAVQNKDVQVFPNQIFIRKPSTSSKFKVLAANSGKYELSFQISGKNSASFPDVPELSVQSDNVFTRYGIPFKGLPEGDYIVDLSIGGNNYRFTSTSQWYKVGSSNIFFSKGITFSSVGNMSVPLSIKGLEVNAVSGLTVGPVSSLRSTSSATVVSGSVMRRKRQDGFDLSIKDINDFIENNSILRTLFTVLGDVLPDWIRLTLDTQDPEIPFFFSQVSSGKIVSKIPYCSGAPVYDETVYHVFRFTHAIIMTILNQDMYLPKTDREEYCIVLDLNNDYGTTFIIMFPDKVANLLETLSVFKNLKKDTGIVVYPNGFGVSLFRKLKVKKESTDLKLWNGDQMFDYPIGETGASFWASLEVGKVLDNSKTFDFAVAPVPIETYVSLPDIRKVFTHVFIDPWEMYLRSIGEPLEITLQVRILKKKYPIKMSTGNFIHHSLEAYGSVGGFEERKYCGPLANPPGLFTTVFVDAKLLRGIPIIQDMVFSLDLEAQAFYRLDDVDIETVPSPIAIVKAVLNNIKQAAQQLVTFILGEITKYVNTIAPVIMAIIETLRDHVQDLIRIVSEFLNSFDVLALAVNVGDLVRDVIASINTISNTIRDLVDQLELMFVDTLNNFVDLVKQKVKEIRENAVSLVTNLYDRTVGIFTGSKTIGVRGYFSITVLRLELGIEGEFVTSDAHLRRCGDLAEIYEHMKGEEAWRAFGAIDAFKIGLGKGKIWSLFSVKLGFGFGLALASDSDKFVVRLHARLNFFGAKASADLFVTNTEITTRTQVDIFDIFTARLTIRSTVFVDAADWALMIRGEFIPGGENSVDISLGDAIRRFVTRLGDEAVKRIDKAQDAVDKAKEKLTGAQRWLDEKKAKVDDANVVFDRAVEKLEGAKRKLEEAKGPFERALQKLRDAQKRVDRLCKIRDCPKICIPGIKFRKCGWFYCPRFTRCMIKIPNLLCIAGNLACRAIRAIAFLALEAAKLFVRIPMLALDAAKAIVSVVQVVVDKSRIILEVVKLAFDIAKGVVEIAKGFLSGVKAALEVVKFAVRAVQYTINFIIKYGLQSIIDIGTCGFEIELSTRDLFEFEIFCDINPFRLGMRTVRFRLNFNNIFGSIWNAAKSLVNSFLSSIKNLLGRRKREIDFEAFSRLHKAFRFRRQTDDGSFESIFENADINNDTILTDTDANSEIAFWERQCHQYKPINDFFLRAFDLLINATSEMEAYMDEIVLRGSEAADILSAFSNMTVDDSEIDYTVAEEDFNVTREQIEEALNGANNGLQDDELVNESKGAAEYIVNQNEEAKATFSRTEILPLWKHQMENVTTDFFLDSECSGVYDCFVWSFGELYQLIDSVNPALLPEAARNLPDLEERVYALFNNDSKTFNEVKNMTLEIADMFRLINAEEVFCATVPVLEEHPANTSAIGGENVILGCSAQSIPSPTYFWYKDDELLAYGTQLDTLSLMNVNTNDKGVYVCVAGNHVANVTSYPATVEVGYKPEIVAGIPHKLEVAHGGKVNVYCNVSSAPPATINWYHQNYVKMQGPTLKLDAVDTTDAGVYICKANNEHGGVISNEMNLVVLESSPACVTRRLQFGYLSDSAGSLTVNDTLLPEELSGLPLEAAFRQIIVSLINSTFNDLTLEVTMSNDIPYTGELSLTAGCEPVTSGCTGNHCAQTYAETQKLLGSILADLQLVISSDKPLFILDGKVYIFNPSLTDPADEISVCPTGYKQLEQDTCVRSSGGPPVNLRITKRLNYGPVAIVLINWDPPKIDGRSTSLELYEVEVSNLHHNPPLKHRLYYRSFGMLLQASYGETRVRVRKTDPDGNSPYAEITIPAPSAQNHPMLPRINFRT